MSYVNLHCHSDHSVRDSTAKIEDIVRRSKEIGMPAVALCDHGTLSGWPYLVKECKKEGLKPIVGVELYTVDERDEKYGKKGEQRDHLILIAKNWDGLQKIFKIVSKANHDKFNGFPRISYQSLLNEDLTDMFVSGACSVGFLKRDNYKEYATAFYEKCGDDFYLEILPASYLLKDTNIDGGRQANERAIELHKEFGINLVATQDSHYVYPEDSETHQVLLCINSRKKMADPDKWSFGEGQLYIKNLNELANSFLNLGYIEPQIIKSAIMKTNEIADQINIEVPNFFVSLPTPYPDRDDNEVANELIMEGWNKHKISEYPNASEYLERLKEEVRVITHFGLMRYFLIVADIYKFLEREKIPKGSGRGSGAGSLMMYLMGITEVDSLEYDLYFPRFLNEGRLHRVTDENGNIQLTAGGLPDVDMDVSKARRQEVVDYIKNKYGHEYVSQLTAFSYFSPKSAFRSVASAYGIDSKTINKLSKLIEEGTYKDDEGNEIPYDQKDSWSHVSELKEFKEVYPIIAEISLKLDGTINSLGKHAAAVMVSSVELSGIGPIDVRNDAEILTYDMKMAEGFFSLLKLDVLGIATADVIYKACELIEGLLPENIPLNDEKAMEILANGETTGLFQMESALGKKTLKEINDGRLNIVSDCSALIRPGALMAMMENGKTAYQNYIERSKGEQPVEYITPKLEVILGETYGVYVMQEAVIATFHELAGFSLAESDIIRRAIGKKEMGTIESYKGQFIEGCIANEITAKQANDIFNSIVKSSTYLFNKSHSIAYAFSTMKQAYLKANYPAEFFAATLTWNNKEEYMQDYIKEASKLGVTIEYPDINKSSASEYVMIDSSTIYSPLNCVKGVGFKAASEIVRTREECGGMFIDHAHFEDQIKSCGAGRTVNKRVKDVLLRVNAFANCGSPIEDPDVLQDDLKTLLSLFSPIPSFKAKGGKAHEKDSYSMLYGEIGLCCQETYNGEYNMVEPIMYSKPNIMVVTGLSKFDNELLQKANTKWMPKTLCHELNIPNADISFVSNVKCGFHGVAPADVPKECKSKCRGFLEREIKIIRPRMIICCLSELFGWMVEDPKAKFMDSMGKIFYSGFLDCYVTPSPSPQFIDYKQEARDIYNDEVIPLLKKCYNV